MPRITPPFAVPSSFVSTIPVTPHRLREHVRLGDRVLAAGGIETSRSRGARPGIALPPRGRTFCSSCISRLVCRRPAVSAMTTSKPSVCGALHAVEDHRGGVAALLAVTTAPPALGPHVELLDGGGAERVAGGEQHLLAVGGELGGELADGRRLAAAVDADDQKHERLCAAAKSTGRPRAATASRSPRRRRNAQTASGSASSRRDSELRISSSSFWLVRTPMSAVSSTFSISSTTDGSIAFLPAKISPRRAMKPQRVRARPGAERGALARGRGGRERDHLGGRRARARRAAGAGFAGFAGARRRARRAGGLGLGPVRAPPPRRRRFLRGLFLFGLRARASSLGLGLAKARAQGPRRRRRSSAGGAARRAANQQEAEQAAGARRRPTMPSSS